MKSSYELAMERLNKSAPARKLTPAQKAHLAELDVKYTAKIAEREIALKGEINAANAQGDMEKVETLQRQLAADRFYQAAVRGSRKSSRANSTARRLDLSRGVVHRLPVARSAGTGTGDTPPDQRS